MAMLRFAFVRGRGRGVRGGQRIATRIAAMTQLFEDVWAICAHHGMCIFFGACPLVRRSSSDSLKWQSPFALVRVATPFPEPRVHAQVLLVPRDGSAASAAVVIRCVADVLRLWREAQPTPVAVGAAMHCGTVSFEADWLWDVTTSSTMRILPGGGAALALGQMCTRVGAGVALASSAVLDGARDVIAPAGLSAMDLGAAETLLSLASGGLAKGLHMSLAQGQGQGTGALPPACCRPGPRYRGAYQCLGCACRRCAVLAAGAAGGAADGPRRLCGTRQHRSAQGQRSARHAVGRRAR